jgi:hypothetical protein
MDKKKIKEKEERERERMRDFGTYQPSVYYWQLHIVLESCLISFTTQKKKHTKQLQKQNLLPSKWKKREREKKLIAPPTRMMMMSQISEGFGFFPCGPT